MLKLGHILPIWYDMLLKVQHINKLALSAPTQLANGLLGWEIKR